MINDASTAFNRFRDYPSLQQGLELGGELLVRASVVAARNGSTVSQDSYDPESEAERGLTQESEIESFSRLNNCWHDDPNAYFRPLGYVFYGYGGEAQVYLEGDSYLSDKVVVEDMHTGNIWKTPENNIVIIDGFFCLNIPGLGLNGTFSF